MCSKKNPRLRVSVTLAVIIFSCPWMMLSGTASAEIISGLVGVEKNFPDICTTFVTGTYTVVGGTGTLTVDGWPSSYSITKDDETSIEEGVDGWSSSIVMTIPTSTTTPTTVLSGLSGTVTICGKVGDANGTLLTGTIEAFGSYVDTDSPTATLFDFRFLVTGGELAGDFGGANVGHAGIILSPAFDEGMGDQAFNGNFGSNFWFNTYTGVTDTFLLVPEPSSAAMVLSSIAVSLMGLALRRSRMKR